MNLEIVLLKNYDENIINQIYNIHAEKLGVGYLTKESIYKGIKNNNILVAFTNQEVVGYLKFAICTEKQFFADESLPLKGNNKKVLALKTCAVKYEKSGIGTALNNYVINKFASKVKKMYCPVWTSKYGTNANKILTNFGFSKIREFPNFWYEDSIGEKDFCPICGTPCTCQKDLYFKQIL